MRRFTEAEITEVWERRQAGELTRSIARRLGRHGSSIRRLFEDAGGVRPSQRRRAERHLSLADREEISRGVAGGESLRSIARRMGRAPSTVSREVARNGAVDDIGLTGLTRQRGVGLVAPRPATWPELVQRLDTLGPCRTTRHQKDPHLLDRAVAGLRSHRGGARQGSP